MRRKRHLKRRCLTRRPPWTNAPAPARAGHDRDATQEEAASPERRSFMKTAAVAGAAGAVAGALHGKFAFAPLISEAQAQRRLPARSGGRRKLGQGRRGRRLQPDHAGEGARCGEMDQGRQDLPHRPRVRSGHAAVRRARLHAAHSRGPTGGPFGDNKLVYHDEFLATEIGQTGTQFDGLGHIGIQMGKDGDKNEMRFYNGFTAQEIGDAYGLKKLGIEKRQAVLHARAI